MFEPAGARATLCHPCRVDAAPASVHLNADETLQGSSKTYSAAAGEAAAIAGTFVEVDLPINSAIVSWQHNIILYEVRD